MKLRQMILFAVLVGNISLPVGGQQASWIYFSIHLGDAFYQIWRVRADGSDADGQGMETP